jgi:GNAT superfamily N-acetyltransferase
MDTRIAPAFFEVSPDQQPFAAAADSLCQETFGDNLNWGDNNHVYIATDGADVLGFANTRINTATNNVNVRFLATDPTMRSIGIGSVILNGVLSEAEEVGCTTASVTPLPPVGAERGSGTRLTRFYENHGFVSPNPDLIGMSKTLNPKA